MRALDFMLPWATAAVLAHGADAIPDCRPLPAVLRFDQPLYPPNVESRGLPNPVSLMVEFTANPDGRASEVVVVEVDAGTYSREFSEQAIRAMNTIRLERVPVACRSRLRMVFRSV